MHEEKTKLAAPRNYGIDLLRLVLMYMVCMLHVLKAGGILDACEGIAVKHGAFWLLEAFCVSAVDGFAIISGYMASDKPPRHSKLLEMWAQVFFYSFVLTAIFTALGIRQSWEPVEMLQAALPVTFSKFWYFTGFVVVFLVGPYIHRVVQTMQRKEARVAILVLALLFVRVIEDPFETGYGYSTLWLLVMYCLGALAKRARLLEAVSSRKLVLLLGLCVWGSWQFYMTLGSTRLMNYISPTVVLSGLVLVVLFSRLQLGGRVLSKLSPLAFGVYLFQLNCVVWDKLTDSFAFLVGKNIVLGVFLAFLAALGIFAAGLTVEKLRCILAKWMKIDVLCRKIVDFAAGKLEKL